MSHHQSVFEKYATPISIIVAGLLIGAGILLSKGMSAKNGTSNNQENIAPTLASSKSKLTLSEKTLENLKIEAENSLADKKSNIEILKQRVELAE
jgi:hypothetical protein